ncbi:hypothetical protein TIFTF001_033100 [Ficus carica]|uniref:Uncharacterized protein n=1 Tax=Ficus carica TaxID=3494 RepID=A0AA88J787_FICCA|nr:hypothetical protein TIFTF001_033100 [Ficus carica]
MREKSGLNHVAALVEEIEHVIVGRKRYDLVHVIHGIENVSLGYVPIATAGDRRRRPIDEDRGLLGDEDRRFYQIRCETRFDIPSLVFVDSAIGIVRPRPRRPLEAGDVPPEPLFDYPITENIVGFGVGLPNHSQRCQYQRSIAGDVPLPVKSRSDF